MRTTLWALAVAALAVGCTGNENQGAVGGFDGAVGSMGGAIGSGGTDGSLGHGGNSLEGPRAFTPADAFSLHLSDGGTLLSIDDGPPGCNPEEGGATRAVHLSLPGAPRIGMYDVGASGDGGAAASYFDFALGSGAELTAVSGTVYLNRNDSEAVGGNFDVMLAWPDGGADSELSGIFSAVPCF